MKYIWVGLLVTAIAGVEFYHELTSGDVSGAAVCMAPDAQQTAIRDMLLNHLRSH